MGSTIWSPLESGILAGRYLNEIPQDSRYNKGAANLDIKPYLDNKEVKKLWDEKLLKLKDIAEKKLNCSLAQLAIAWILANPDCSSIILGSSKVSQLEEAKLSLEREKIEANIKIEMFKAKTERTYKESVAANDTKRTEIELL